jgi:four helix bundle protein
VGIDDFRDLEVWQRAMDLQRSSHAVARRFPPEARYELGSQLRRASGSVVTNIVEGHGQSTRANYRRYVGIARGPAREVHSHLLSAEDVGYVTHSEVAESLELVERVRQMLTKLYDRLGDAP